MAHGAAGSIDFGNLYVRLPGASPRECIQDAMEWRLPSSLLPSFLHEATHWWCLTTPVGNALAALASKASLAMYGMDVPIPGEKLHALWAAYASFTILRPLLEGLALFAEHDVEPGPYSAQSEPLGLVIRLFAARKPEWGGGLSTEVMDAHVKAMLAQTRISEDGVERKTQLLTTPLDDPSGYLSGYLLVRSLHERAKLKSARAHDRDLFLMYLRSYLFEDGELARCLLEHPMPDGGRPGKAPLLRIGRRLRSLVSDTLDSRLRTYELSVSAGEEHRECLDRNGEDWASVRDRTEREADRLRVAGAAHFSGRPRNEPVAAHSLFLWAGLAHRAVIPVAVADGLFSSARGGPCRFAFEDGGVIDLNPASPKREPGETRARFFTCLMPRDSRDLAFDRDLMIFACFAEHEPIWWAFLESGPKNFGWLEEFPRGDAGSKLLRTLASLPMISNGHEFTRISHELLRDIVTTELSDASAALAAEIHRFYASRALSRVKPGLQQKCGMALGEAGFWGPLKIGSDGDAVRALALMGLCAGAGGSVQVAMDHLTAFGIDPIETSAKISHACRKYGLPLCTFSPTNANGSGGGAEFRCFP